MKSVVIQQPNELVIEERPRPAPGAGEVRVKITLAPKAACLALMSVCP